MNIKEILTLPNYIMIGLLIASGICLFIPDTLAAQMYIINLRHDYGLYIGLVFIITFSILVVNLGYKITEYLRYRASAKRFIKTMDERLSSLSRYQKAIIYTLYKKDNATLSLPINDGAIVEMTNHQMIKPTRNEQYLISSRNPKASYMLQPWVIDNMKNNPDMLSSFKESFNSKVMEDKRKKRNK